jgi:hypothetical protein
MKLRGKMKKESLDSAIELAQKLEHVFVATADSSGMPHVAAAGLMRRTSENCVAVSAWFCPGTLANLDHNRSVSLVVWDPPSDAGYQILGEVQEIDEVAMMNGFSPSGGKSPPMPQVEKKLDVRVDRVYCFSHAPHSDTEEW